PKPGDYFLYRQGVATRVRASAFVRVLASLSKFSYRALMYLTYRLHIEPIVPRWILRQIDLLSIFRLVQLIRREAIQLVQAEFLDSAGLAMIAAHLTGRKVVVDDHAIEWKLLRDLGG